MLRSLSFVVVALVASPLFAVNCNGTICNTRSNYVSPVVTSSYVAPSYVAPTSYVPQYVTQNIFYEVGGASALYPAVPNQNIAAAEYGQMTREMQRLQDRMADWKASQPQPPQQQPINVYLQLPPGSQPAGQPAAQPTMPQQPAPQQPAANPQFSLQQKPGAIIESRCVKCHSGANAKGGLDLTQALSCEQKLATIRKVINGEMPKGGPPLTPEEIGDFMQEILQSKTEAGPPAHAVISKTNAQQLAELVNLTKEK